MATRVEIIDTRKQVRDSGIVWKVDLEKVYSKTGKSATYMIYCYGGQSYPVGTFRSLTKAMEVLDSFELYKK